MSPPESVAGYPEGMRLCPPDLFVSAEADGFASFLEAKALPIPYLSEVLAFEHALIRAVLYEQGSTVVFEHEATELLDSLEQGRMPREPARKTTALVVRPG